MKIKNILVFHLFILGMVLPQFVFAEDFTLNVPVNLSNMNEDATRLKVNCSVAPETGAFTFGGSKNLSISADGSLNATAEVKFNAPGGQNPASLKRYRCEFQLARASGGFFVPVSSGALNNISTCVQPGNQWKCTGGSPFVRVVQGTFP